MDHCAVVAGMIYPEAFTNWGGFDLRNKWLILVIIQLVMFGMGIQMSLKDFSADWHQQAKVCWLVCFVIFPLCR